MSAIATQANSSAAVWMEYRAIIDNSIDRAPRNLQRTIGPSEIGVPCDRCLISKLAAIKEDSQYGQQWLPFVGTCVHYGIANAFEVYEMHSEPSRFLIEHRFSVGYIGDDEITGSADLFDRMTGEVTDWKIVGNSTIRDVRSHG